MAKLSSSFGEVARFVPISMGLSQFRWWKLNADCLPLSKAT